MVLYFRQAIAFAWLYITNITSFLYKLCVLIQQTNTTSKKLLDIEM